MRIPIFVSVPNTLTARQEKSRDQIEAELDRYNFEPRTLGRSDYAIETPLKEVLVLARRCAGALILGYSQLQADSALIKPGTAHERKELNIKLPTPWNQVEAGIVFSLGLPMLVFREPGVSGGILDIGSGDLFVHRMPFMEEDEPDRGFREAMIRWQSRVRDNYYR